MELPIDHFRLLGVSPAIDAQSVLRTLEQRLDRPPQDGFTEEALEARAQLLRESADLLSDDRRRQRYEAELTAVIEGDPGVIPALVIPSSREVGGLILLWEAGQGLQAFELASRSLQPPRAPALGSGRESDLALVAGLACRQAAEEDQQERQYERAAEVLLKGQQLLQRMGQHAALRQALARERDALLPYRVLQLLSRPAVQERREGLALLDRLVERRQGLDGDADPDFARPAFEAFLSQIRPYLTVQEQIDLFERWALEGSRRASVLAAMALAASGFAQRKPQRIADAATRLRTLDPEGLVRPVACLTLLLGQVEEAQALFLSRPASAGPSDADPSSAGKLSATPLTPPEAAGPDDQAGDSATVSPLAELCLTCAGWLQSEVLPGYRDVEIEADLEAWFADRDVQDYIDQQDRRLGRRRAVQSQTPPPTPPFLQTGAGGELPPPLGIVAGDPGAPAFMAGSAFDSDPDHQHDPDDAENDAEAWDDDDQDAGPGWRWPQLPSLSLPFLRLPPAWRPSHAVPDLKPLHWLAVGGGVALVATLAWTLRPKPQPLTVQAPTAAVPPPAATGAATSTPPRLPPPIATADVPLRATRPNAAQWRVLLERWLEVKAEVLAGKPPSTALDQLAAPEQLDRLTSARNADQRAGHHMSIEASISDLRVRELDPETIELLAEIRYSDKLLDQNGRVLRSDPPKTLRNTYVFGRQADGLWRLTDFRPGS